MAVDSAFETYAAEPDGPARRVRRRVGPHHLAPQPAPALHQVPGEGRAPADDLPREDDQPGEEEDERLPPEERDRRREWRQLPADVRHELMKFHVSMGHLSHVGMMRLLRRAGARPDVIKAVPLLNCQACGDRLRAKQPRPVRHADCTTFNHKISVDTVTVHDVDGYPYHFLNIVCEATGFQVMAYLNAGTGVPSASLMVRSLRLRGLRGQGSRPSSSATAGRRTRARSRTTSGRTTSRSPRPPSRAPGRTAGVSEPTDFGRSSSPLAWRIATSRAKTT